MTDHRTESPASVDWANIDTVLLDMDGTLIDLHFDNTLWNTRLPATYARTHNLSIEHAREHLFERMRLNARTIEFYCIEYWAEFTDLNIMALHEELAHLLCYRPGTEDFLQWLKSKACTTLIATNAHRHSFNFKNDHLALTGHVDGVVSSHDYQQVKEGADFWQLLCERENINPARSLFIDDNEQVLDAAADFGIREVVCVASPDSKRAPRTTSAHKMVHALSDLIAD